MESRQRKNSVRKYRAPRDVESAIREIRIKTCQECLEDAVNKNIKAKSSPPPENWNAEVWLCFRLRKNGKCPFGLPPISA